jgi:hypothetical protein
MRERGVVKLEFINVYFIQTPPAAILISATFSSVSHRHRWSHSIKCRHSSPDQRYRFQAPQKRFASFRKRHSASSPTTNWQLYETHNQPVKERLYSS